jgi:hypothetical protein
VLPSAPQYDFTVVGILVVVLAAILGGMLLLMARRESQKKELIFDSVRKLRESRQALKAKKKVEPTASPAPDASAAAGQPKPSQDG